MSNFFIPFYKQANSEEKEVLRMKLIENQTFEQERALYNCRGLIIKNCSFDGPADGESALKECAQIQAERCFFKMCIRDRL